MASATTPTAANIISSLGVRGATVDENRPGFVPVLDDRGMLSARLIPADAAQLAIPPLSEVAYVDPMTDVEAGIRKGSAAAPFASVSEAAERFRPPAEAGGVRRVAFILAPGDYPDNEAAFPPGVSPRNVYLIGLGRCRLTGASFSISGMEASPHAGVVLQNIVSNGTFLVDGAPTVTCLGETYVHEMSFGASGATLRLSAESRVDSTSADAVVDLLSDAGHVENTSSVPGDTVEDALDRLFGRKVRVARISPAEMGFDIESSFDDVAAESSGGTDVYDLRGRDLMFARAINDILDHGRFVSITATSVAADVVSAEVAEAREVRASAVSLGGYRVEVDAYGYLVVSERSYGSPSSPDAVASLRDSETGDLYVLSALGGRLSLRLEAAAGDGSDSSDSSDSSGPEAGGYADSVSVTDPDSGRVYALRVSGGRLIISSDT